MQNMTRREFIRVSGGVAASAVAARLTYQLAQPVEADALGIEITVGTVIAGLLVATGLGTLIFGPAFTPDKYKEQIGQSFLDFIGNTANQASIVSHAAADRAKAGASAAGKFATDTEIKEALTAGTIADTIGGWLDSAGNIALDGINALTGTAGAFWGAVKAWIDSLLPSSVITDGVNGVGSVDNVRNSQVVSNSDSSLKLNCYQTDQITAQAVNGGNPVNGITWSPSAQDCQFYSVTYDRSAGKIVQIRAVYGTPIGNLGYYQGNTRAEVQMRPYTLFEYSGNSTSWYATQSDDSVHTSVLTANYAWSNGWTTYGVYGGTLPSNVTGNILPTVVSPAIDSMPVYGDDVIFPGWGNPVIGRDLVIDGTTGEITAPGSLGAYEDVIGLPTPTNWAHDVVIGPGAGLVDSIPRGIDQTYADDGSIAIGVDVPIGIGLKQGDVSVPVTLTPAQLAELQKYLAGEAAWPASVPTWWPSALTWPGSVAVPADVPIATSVTNAVDVPVTPGPDEPSTDDPPWQPITDIHWEKLFPFNLIYLSVRTWHDFLHT